MRYGPLTALLRTLYYLLAGRLHFPRDRVGEAITMEDGQRFTVFRQVVVDAGAGRPKRPGATFVVRFQVAGLSPEQNKRFSVLPMLFCVGFPGFRSKLWTLNEETGDFQGIYEWDTVADAERYANSFAMKFMTRRSVPGSVEYEIAKLPNGS